VTTSLPTVGFIGLGSQGGPMARAVIDAGYDTVLWARRPESLEPFRRHARVAPTPAALAEQAQVIGICVLADEDVVDVALRADGLLAGVNPATTVLIHSTVHPRTCVHLGERFRERGAHVLDAPVSGGGRAALERRLLVMVGGEEEVYTDVAPILSAFGDPVVYLGGLGSGQLAKLVNNLLLTANLSLAQQAVHLGRPLGIDEGALIGLLQHGSGRSFALQMYSGFHADLESSSAYVSSVAELLHKDVDLADRLTTEGDLDAGLLFDAAYRVLAAMTQRPPETFHHDKNNRRPQ